LKYLFSRSGLEALAKIDPGQTLLAFDFDGTIAPEVEVPAKARTPVKSIPLIKELMKKTDVAIISGRALEDLKPKLGFRPQYLLGNHGLQSPWTKDEERRARKVIKGWVRDLLAAWPFEDNSPAYIENKGSSLSVHFRHIPNVKKAQREFIKVSNTLKPPPRIVGGKFVLNLTLSGAPDKGSALLKLMKRSKHRTALFAGDDITDEDVFRLKEKSLFTVRVGKSRSSRAQYYVHDQKEFVQLLLYLLKH